MTISWPHVYVFVLVVSILLSVSYTALFKKIARSLDFMDRPKGERHKAHAHATPLLGGAAMFSAWLSCLVAGYFIIDFGAFGHFSNTLAMHRNGITTISPNLFFLMLGAFIAMFMGLWDDAKGLPASIKFGGQFVVAAIAVTLGGVHLTLFINYPPLTWVISILWIMLLMNSINFFDNMDGLAIGIFSIAMGFFGGIAAYNHQYLIAIFALLNCGVGIGFWFHNHSPATIFMGDSGSHFIGYLLAVISTGVNYFNPEVSLSRFPILLPLFILAVPLFDTLSVVIIRIKNHKPIWVGDHNHLSHRFVRLGMTRKRAVFLVHLLAVIISISALPTLWGSFKTSLFIIAEVILLLIFVTLILNTRKASDLTRDADKK